MIESEQQRLEKLFTKNEGCGLFGVTIDKQKITILGMGNISVSQKALIVLSLKYLSKKLESEIIGDDGKLYTQWK